MADEKKKEDDMKLTVKAGPLRHAIELAHRVSSKANSKLFTELVQLEADPLFGLKVQGTSMDCGFQAMLPCDVRRTGKATLRGPELHRLLGSLPPDEEVQVQATTSAAQTADAGPPGECSTLEVKHRRGSATVIETVQSALPAPALPDVSGCPDVLLSELTNAWSCVRHSVSKDQTRPALTGAWIGDRGDGAELVTTSGYVMSLFQPGSLSELLDDGNRYHGIVVPAELMESLPYLEAYSPTVRLRLVDNVLWVVAGDAELWGRLVLNTFPDFRRMLPAEDKALRFAVELEDLEQALSWAALMSEQDKVVLTVQDGRLSLSCGASSGSSRVPVACSADGQGKVTVNVRYLKDVLRSAKHAGRSLTVSAEGGNRPLLVQSGAGRWVIALIAD